MSLLINNSIHMNKLGEDTFISKIEKGNQNLMSQNSIVNSDEKSEVHESEMNVKAKEEEIAKRIARGEQVSLKDVKYIKKHNPDLLKSAKRIKAETKKVKNEIKNAKDNKEADNIIDSESMKALSKMVSQNGEISIEGQLKSEAVKKIKNETGYKRIDRLV